MEDPTRTTLGYSTPGPNGPVRDRSGPLIAGFIVGLVLGLACMWLAFGLGGLGHGWGAASSVSGLALVTSPLAGVALAMRRRAAGKGLALLLLAAAIVADLTLRTEAREEESYYFDRAWSDSRVYVVAWAALWAAWQVAALAALLWPGPLMRRPEPEEQSSDR